MLNNLFFNFIKKNRTHDNLLLLSQKNVVITRRGEKSQYEENFDGGKPYKMKFKKNEKNNKQNKKSNQIKLTKMRVIMLAILGSISIEWISKQ